jgi:hypothetical protein
MDISTTWVLVASPLLSLGRPPHWIPHIKNPEAVTVIRCVSITNILIDDPITTVYVDPNSSLGVTLMQTAQTIAICSEACASNASTAALPASFQLILFTCTTNRAPNPLLS